jgi:hypothetical protein
MTKAEFDRALERLQHEGWRLHGANNTQARVFAAACFVMKHRAGISDDQVWEGPTDAELAEFLAGLDRPRRKRLKEIAEDLEGAGLH